MAVFNGEKLNIEIYGTSHAEKIGVKASGFPRLKVDFENLDKFMKRRSPSGGIFSTKRKEPDLPIFEKGLDNGVIGGDFEVVIYNKDVKSGDYNNLYAKRAQYAHWSGKPSRKFSTATVIFLAVF